jgi:hypothetical protein
MLNELENNAQEAQQEVQVEQIQEKPAEQPKDTQKEQNLRILRERAERAERRAAEVEQMMQQQKQLQYQQPVQQAQAEEEFHVEDDSYLDGKKFKTYLNKQKQDEKKQREENQRLQTQILSSLAEQRIRAELPDFDQVVSTENLKNLAAVKSESYQSMMSNPDLYAKAKTAYDMIKSYGLHEDYTDMNKKIADNKGKPRTAASVAPQQADTPLVRVGDYDRRILSDAQKLENMKRVQIYKNNLK